MSNKAIRNKRYKDKSNWEGFVLKLKGHHGCSTRTHRFDSGRVEVYFRKDGATIPFLYAEWDGGEGTASDNSDNPIRGSIK